MKKLLSGILASTLLLSMATVSVATEIHDAPTAIYTNTLSSITLDSKYVNVESFSEGFAVVETAEGYFGVIDTQGNEVVAPIYGEINDYSEGFAAFRSPHFYEMPDYDEENWEAPAYYGFLNNQGDEVYVRHCTGDNFKAGYSDFNGGYTSFVEQRSGQTEDGGYWSGEFTHSMDIYGNVLEIPAGYYHGDGFSDEGLMWVSSMEDNSISFINRQGDVVLETEYYSVASVGFQDGLCAVSNADGLWGYINALGEVVIPCQFTHFWNSTENIIATAQEQGKITFVDHGGNDLFSFSFEETGGHYGFSEGYTIFNRDRKHGLMDNQGNIVIEPIYDNSINMKNGYVCFATGEVIYDQWGEYERFDGVWGIFDAQGNEVLPVAYEDVGIVDSTKYFVKTNGVYTIEQFGNAAPSLDGTVETTGPSYDMWVEPHYNTAVSNGLLVESLGNNLKTSINREQIADLLVNMIEKKTGQTLSAAAADTFTDTNASSVLKAYEAGIITGRGEGIFAPGDNASRQELALMTYKAIVKMEDILGKSLVSDNSSSYGYEDQGSVDTWAANAVNILANNGIMTGADGFFSPASTISIQECIVVNNNLFDMNS